MNIENMFDKPDVKQLVHAFSLLDDENDIQAFLTDICTPREICDLSQRLQVARYLDEGEPYVEVQARTGASSTTVSRVSKALNGEYGGYRKILIKLEDGENRPFGGCFLIPWGRRKTDRRVRLTPSVIRFPPSPRDQICWRGANLSAWAGRMDALIIANGLSGGPCLFESIPPIPVRT